MASKKPLGWAFFGHRKAVTDVTPSVYLSTAAFAAKGISSGGGMEWKRDNGTKGMLHHVRTFHKAMLDSCEAGLVTGTVTKKRKAAEIMAELNKFWAEKGCKKYAVDNNKQRSSRRTLVSLSEKDWSLEIDHHWCILFIRGEAGFCLLRA